MRALPSEYRAITQTFLLDIRTLLLSDWAFRVLIILKLEIGPTGIGRYYGLREMLNRYLPMWPEQGESERSELAVLLGPDAVATAGVRLDAIEPALRELESADLIRRDGSMVWVCGQLAESPFYSPSNPKHRRFVQSYVEKLDPHEPLVAAWREAHKEWLTVGEAVSDTLSDSHPIASREVSGSRSTQNTNTQDTTTHGGRGAALLKARQRLALYAKHGLDRSGSDFDARVNAAVTEGAWPTREDALEELERVRPWDVARTSKDSADAMFRVAERLG